MIKKILFIFVASLIILSCRAGQEVRTDPGTGHTFRDGYPEVKSRVTSFYNDSLQPVIDLSLEIPYSSLIFRTIEGVRSSDIRVQVTIRKNDDTAQVVQRYSEEFNIIPSESLSRMALFVQESFLVDPGNYLVNVAVTDLASSKVSPVDLTVVVPNPDTEAASLTDIRISISDQDLTGKRSVSSYIIPATGDSLSFEFFVSRSDMDTLVDVELKLQKINSDTSSARPFGALPVTIGSLQYRGIDYNDTSTITSQSRTLDTELGSILVEFTVPTPSSGNYRFEVNLTATGTGDKIENFNKFRDFLIVSPNFPQIQSIQELAKPMGYLMTPREFRNLMRHNDPDSLRRAFDRFWLNNIRDREKARDVIELYYSRVEEANRLFTNFKEGWKTDMGMAYILLGPPVNIDSTIDGMIWYYSYSRLDPTTVLQFERARVTGSAFPFTHYILFRQRFYQTLEIEVINDWLSGDVLVRRR